MSEINVCKTISEPEAKFSEAVTLYSAQHCQLILSVHAAVKGFADEKK